MSLAPQDIVNVFLTGGTVNYNGSNTAFIGDLAMTSGTLGGTNAVTVGNIFNWFGGTITGSGPIVAFSGLDISNNTANLNLIGRTVVNSTNGTWVSSPGGSITLINGASISNAVGAVLNMVSGGAIGNGGGANSIINSGLLEVTGSSGTVTVGVPYNNSGTTIVETASMILNSGSTSTGLMDVGPGPGTSSLRRNP